MRVTGESLPLGVRMGLFACSICACRTNTGKERWGRGGGRGQVTKGKSEAFSFSFSFYSNIATFTEHKSWTVGVAMPKVRDNV